MSSTQVSLLFTFVSFFSYGTGCDHNVPEIFILFGGSRNLSLPQHKFNPFPINNGGAQDYALSRTRINTTINNYSEPEDTVTRAFSFFGKLYIRYSFKNKAPAIPSGTFVAYEILPIGVSERHHDVKARMFRGCLVGVDLQRVRERTDEELICCFVLEDLESDGNNYFWFLVR